MIATTSRALFRRWLVDPTPGEWSIPERPPRHLRILQRATLGAFMFIFALLLAMVTRTPQAVTTGYAVGVLISLPVIAYWYARPRLVFAARDVEPGSAFERACETVLAAYRDAVNRASSLPSAAAREARREAAVLASSAATAAWRDDDTAPSVEAWVAELKAVGRSRG